jgi:hypothetical protein
MRPTIRNSEYAKDEWRIAGQTPNIGLSLVSVVGFAEAKIAVTFPLLPPCKQMEAT